MSSPIHRYLDAHPDVSVRDLARDAGLATATVYNILSGQTKQLTPRVMRALVRGSWGEITIEELQAWNMR